MTEHFCMLLVVKLAFLVIAITAGDAAVVPEGCTRKCGNLSVPYPFGMEKEYDEQCYLQRQAAFGLTCNRTFDPPKLFSGNIEVTSINLSAGQITVLLDLSYNCYDNSGLQKWSTWNISLTSHYALSSTDNIFSAVGCDTLARFNINDNNFAGCISGCNSINDVADGNCTGIGCCSASIPPGVHWYSTNFFNRSNTSKAFSFNTCSYSFIVQKDNYTFSKSDLTRMDLKRSFPVVLNFAIANTTCEEAKNTSPYACVSGRSECVDAAGSIGYICKCSQGYQGNPYILNGCQDIDECQASREVYPCYGICTNLPGSYNCTCLEGYYPADDPKKIKCTSKPELKPQKADLPLVIILALGIGGGVLILLLIGAICCLEYQRRKLNFLRMKNFENHGGSFLQQLLSNEGTNFKIFSLNELLRATNGFHKEQILGSGGFGTVYKGTLDDKRLVAIKRANISNEKNGRDFANELFILSKVNHRFIVELLGCCLEDEVPMLVYKFIPKGTLYDFIHGRNNQGISFATRLRIALEAAEAFKYLHSDASTPILHGDVKSPNILLDDGYVAKISDFGTSKLSPQDKKQFTTLVQGTYGYLDPEYMFNGHLTAKSDVYSFGVVLVELLTRRKPFNFDAESEEERSLASKFIACMENDGLREILDPEIIQGGLTYEVLKVADVARRCLNVKGKERPTMREVVMELGEIRVPEMHPWVPPPTREEDTTPLMGRGPPSSSLEIGLANHTTLGIGGR